MKQVKISYILMAFLATFSGNSFAMGGKFAQKMSEFGRKAAPYAKKAFGPICGTIGFGLAAGPLWKKGAFSARCVYEGNNSSSNLKDASPLLRDFCHEELGAVDLDPTKIPIKILDDPTVNYPAGAVNDKYIVISNANAEQIEKLLSEKNSLEQISNNGVTSDEHAQKVFWNKRFLNWQRHIIQHEATHIKNKDVLRRAGAAFVIPLITHAGFALLKRKTPITTLGHLKKIPLGLGKGLINMLAFVAFKRHQEQQADAGVINNRDFLIDGQQLSLSRHHSVMQEVFKKYPHYYSMSKTSQNLIYASHCFVLSPDHPTPLTRAQKFEERIAKLKAKEQATKQQQQG